MPASSLATLPSPVRDWDRCLNFKPPLDDVPDGCDLRPSFLRIERYGRRIRRAGCCQDRVVHATRDGLVCAAVMPLPACGFCPSVSPACVQVYWPRISGLNAAIGHGRRHGGFIILHAVFQPSSVQSRVCTGRAAGRADLPSWEISQCRAARANLVSASVLLLDSNNGERSGRVAMSLTQPREDGPRCSRRSGRTLIRGGSSLRGPPTGLTTA